MYETDRKRGMKEGTCFLMPSQLGKTDRQDRDTKRVCNMSLFV